VLLAQSQTTTSPILEPLPDPVKECTQAASQAAGSLYTGRSGATVGVGTIMNLLLGRNPTVGLGVSAVANADVYSIIYGSTLSGCLNGQGIATFPFTP
jgi:hypothetical protein